MSVVLVSNELDNTELKRMVFNFLRKEHKAKISLMQNHRGYREYNVNGEDIPKGNFNVIVEEIVPGVIAINLEKA